MTESMDIVRLSDGVDAPNPYNFLNPVRDMGSFAGRESELRDIRYCLDQSMNSQTPMHLAIVGPRASGKTSLLNMVGAISVERGYCPVQVYLTMGDSESELLFFNRIFEALLFASCERGAFGGLTGNTYFTYRDMVDSFIIPDDKTFCPFLFPIQFANAMKRGNVHAPVSDLAIIHDCGVIAQELQAMIVLCLDECDVLTSHPNILQRIRGVLQRITGVVFVFAGTPAMFPTIDDVFSPLARQFKKIRIGAFTERSEIQDCILKPLSASGVQSPRQLFNSETYRELCELRGVAGGNPYELQLVCHYLYRQLDSGESETLELTLDVLEAVLKELEHEQDITKHWIVQEMRSWDKAELTSLGTLCICNGTATFDQLMWYFRVVHGVADEFIDDMQLALSWMVDRGVISVDDDIIRFVGDEFDRLYSKYLAKRFGVEAYVNFIPIDVFFRLGLFDAVVRMLEPETVAVEISLPSPASERLLVQTLRSLASGDQPDEWVSRPPKLLADAYSIHVANQDIGEIPLTRLSLNACGVAATVTVIRGFGVATWEPSAVGSQLNMLRCRIEDAGGKLAIAESRIPVCDTDTILSTLNRLNATDALDAIRTYHSSQAGEEYEVRRNLQAALKHAIRSYAIRQGADDANNLAYLGMVNGQYQEAAQLLDTIVLDSCEAFTGALVMYNQSVSRVMTGRLRESQDLLDRARRVADSIDPLERQCLCLLVPLWDDAMTRWELIERMHPDLLDAILEAQAELVDRVIN